MSVDALDESRPLPFRPGEGPFRVKGGAYRGHLDYVAEQIPGGVEEMLRGFRDPALASFFQQKFLPSTFYDIIPLVTAGYVCARQSRKTFSEFLRIRSRYQAAKDIGGVYRMLLKMVSPMSAVERLPVHMAQYFDFLAEQQFTKLAPNKAELSCGKIPAMLSTWFSTVMEAYGEAVLTASGGKNVLTRSATPFEADGLVHGVPAVRWRANVSWE